MKVQYKNGVAANVPEGLGRRLVRIGIAKSLEPVDVPDPAAGDPAADDPAADDEQDSADPVAAQGEAPAEPADGERQTRTLSRRERRQYARRDMTAE